MRGGFYGITQDSSINDMVTAAFQSIAFQTKEITTILENYDIEINKLLVDGGMVNNNTFCQVLSDTLGKDIIQPSNVESTAIGACKVAMIGSGEDLSNITDDSPSIYKPNLELVKVYEDNHAKWKGYLLNSLKN